MPSVYLSIDEFQHSVPITAWLLLIIKIIIIVLIIIVIIIVIIIIDNLKNTILLDRSHFSRIATIDLDVIWSVSAKSGANGKESSVGFSKHEGRMLGFSPHIWDGSALARMLRPP